MRIPNLSAGVVRLASAAGQVDQESTANYVPRKIKGVRNEWHCRIPAKDLCRNAPEQWEAGFRQLNYLQANRREYRRKS